MSNNNLKRAYLLLAFLATIASGSVLITEEKVERETQTVEYKTASFHSPGGSFGGVNNVGHPGGAKAASMGVGIAYDKIVIPKSNVGHAIPSLNRPNIVNLWGHYVHDEHRSPYASHLYNVTREELEERQQKYVEKMERVREEWGAWNFRDPRQGSGGDTSNPANGGGNRAVADFSKTNYRDMQPEKFPLDSWQADEMYVNSFLDEAKKLVERVKEAVFAEYGYGSKDENGKPRDEAFLENRDELWKIHVWDDEDCEDGDIVKCKLDFSEGIANFQKHTFDGLVRKLLHAMMTNDEFYVVLAGHSAAAGHGNNFQQNRIMTFHHLMEPVFDKLGVRLISRNMAMGGVGTLQFSLAGGDLYGETDFLEWDSGMTEKGSPVDLFNKQAILSGEHVPIIMTEHFFDIMDETNGTAWMGRYIKNSEAKLFPETTWENYSSQPYAARWFEEKERSEKYNAICWEPRSDFTPMTHQNESPGSQVGWHPGNRQHQWSGRKVALIMLEALGVALERWEEGVAEDGYPLASSYWHVGSIYQEMRETLRTHVNTPKPGAKDTDPRSQCEKLVGDLPRVCRVQMHGFGAWTPRASNEFDFYNIIHSAPNGYKPYLPESNAYDGFDVLPLNQAVGDDEVDPHAVAIATTNPPPDLDHSWIEDDDLTDVDEVVDGEELPPPTRRWLREASEHAFRRAAEVFPPSNKVTERKLLPETPPGNLRRQLAEEIVPGRGWEAHGWKTTNGFCDGSAQSECARDPENKCMMYGANDNHLDVWGTAMSGWLVFTVPKVREGIILVRLEWWCGTGSNKNKLTEKWTEVNDGMTTDTTPWDDPTRRAMVETSKNIDQEDYTHRDLGKADMNKLIPQDLEFDYAINGVVKTMKHDEWKGHATPMGQNVGVWPLLDDISMAERDWEGESVEVAIRFRSKQSPQIPYCISHVYYA